MHVSRNHPCQFPQPEILGVKGESSHESACDGRRVCLNCVKRRRGIRKNDEPVNACGAGSIFRGHQAAVEDLRIQVMRGVE